MSFDQHDDPLGVYEINNLQINENGQHGYVSVCFCNSAYKEKTLMLNNTDGIEKVIFNVVIHAVKE